VVATAGEGEVAIQAAAMEAAALEAAWAVAAQAAKAGTGEEATAVAYLETGMEAEGAAGAPPVAWTVVECGVAQVENSVGKRSRGHGAAVRTVAAELPEETVARGEVAAVVLVVAAARMVRQAEGAEAAGKAAAEKAARAATGRRARETSLPRKGSCDHSRSHTA
jgi:hypothetical protein